MPYPTPAKEFDGVTTGLKLLEAAVDLIALVEGQPEKQPEYLQEAANLIKDAWMAVQTAAGRALDAEETGKRMAGKRRCLLCQQWKLEAEMVRLTSHQQEKPGRPANRWWKCRQCLGLPVEEQEDPFAPEEGGDDLRGAD